jgi:predicted PhzF superfamily epimerase YddE/YHI9
MKLPIYQVDAFTDRPFRGNPAAVCPLERWLPDETLQSIAAENNISETAYYIPSGASPDGRYCLRWFTPAVEVDLCGHATLASAHVIWAIRHESAAARLRFQTRSGELTVERDGPLYAMDFPARPPIECAGQAEVAAALRTKPERVLGARDYLCVFADEDQVRGIAPEMEKIARLERFAVIVTAPGRDSDFVSRFFAPAQGIPEDPVTGSAHCTLIPYWSQRLGKKALFARQVSRRGGELWCEDRGDRVRIAGHAANFLTGEIELAIVPT